MGKLILFGNILGPTPAADQLFAPRYRELVASLNGIIGESDKGARRFLSHFRDALSVPIHHFPVALFRKKTESSEINFLLEPLEEGQTWGYVSDGGLPCIADPGHLLVQKCRKKNFAVEACLGPSSIFYALILSGFDGNRFSFNGYFPKEPVKRKEVIVTAAKRAALEQSVQVFIETPYRNWAAVETLLEALPEKASLCIAESLMLPEQSVVTKSVCAWRKEPPQLGKVPAVFLIA